MKISYGSVCSGIEAASVAWESLGFSPAWFSQFDPDHKYKNGPDFPSAVLAHHWPEVSNLGDMTKLAALMRTGAIEAPDILVGGTPCQAFSVAGARAGLADPRGQLTIAYVELADAIDEQRAKQGKPPVIIVWENVPGVLSSKDNAFGAFTGLLAGEDCELQPPGKRWTNAGCVLRNKRAVAWRILDAQYFGVAQRRRRVFVIASARTDIDPTKILFESDGVRRDTAPGRGAGKETTGTSGSSVKVGSHWDNPANPHPTLNQSHNIGGIGQSNQELFSQRGCGIISMAHGQSGAEIKTDNSAPTLTCNHEAPIVSSSIVVRRLTPVECERLQGFPDNHTLIPVDKRKQITAEEYAYLRHHNPLMTAEQAYKFAADGPRYKAIGNSMAVPVMRWIGGRICEALVRANLPELCTTRDQQVA